jgi:hypothetical protein
VASQVPIPKDLQAILGRDAPFDEAHPYIGWRIPAVIATERALLANDDSRIVTSWVNASQAEWTLPQRAAIQQVMGGALRYVHRSRYRKTHYSTFQVRMTFQTGNILASQYDERMPPGLRDFYKFMSIMDEEPLLPDGRENYHVMLHTSLAFPAIILRGWFTPEGPSWTENSSEGQTVNWTAAMEVVTSTPALHNAEELIRAFEVRWDMLAIAG